MGRGVGVVGVRLGDVKMRNLWEGWCGGGRYELFERERECWVGNCG